MPNKCLCIICRDKRKNMGSLFCNKCILKDIFTKILYFRNSPEFRIGWEDRTKIRGRLPNKEQLVMMPYKEEQNE